MTRFVTLDVRPVLAAGDEPLAAILQAADALTTGQNLRLIAPFRPVPLFRVMERRGYVHHETRLDGGDWQIEFSRPEQALSQGSALGAFDWPEPVVSLDLTGLPPADLPRRIRTALLSTGPGEVAFLLLDDEPVALLSDLATAGHEWAGNHAADGGSYRLLLRRGA